MSQHGSGGSSISIQRGKILIYRVFDVAEEIDLHKVERILSAGGESRLKLSQTSSQAVLIRNAPVRLSLGDSELRISDRSVRAETFATVWDYGVVSFSFQLPISAGTRWTDLVRIGEAINETGSTGRIDNDIDEVAIKKSHELVQLLGSALKRPGEWGVVEDYVIYFFEEIAGVARAQDLHALVDIPALILGEPKESIAEKNRQGILDSTFQYAENDLTVIDWNSAMVLEPTGSREITDVLEFALTHMLELRYYDDLLDRRLTELYDAIDVKRKFPFFSRFGRLSRDANSRYLEFSEFMERIDNSLKVVGDFYLAVLFRAAVRRFRIMDWQESITRKMNLLARVSELLQGEMNVARSHLLELTIIVLILFEILSALTR